MSQRKRRPRRRHNWPLIETAYVTREDEPTTATIAEEFDLSKSLVDKHCGDDKWVEKRTAWKQAVAERAREGLLESQAERKKKLIGIVQGAVNKIQEAIKNGQVDFAVKDLDSMVRLLMFLEGGPDSRREIVGGIEDVTEEQELLIYEILAKGEASSGG